MARNVENGWHCCKKSDVDPNSNYIHVISKYSIQLNSNSQYTGPKGHLDLPIPIQVPESELGIVILMSHHANNIW